MNNSNIPMGADTSDATWNEPINETMTFNVEITQTLSKRTEVKTKDYYYEGGFPLTDDTDWEEALKENAIPTPLDLIKILRSMLQDGAVYINKEISKQLIEQCDEWTVEDTEIEEC